MNTIIDLSAVEKTWSAINARIARHPVFQVVPDIAMITIESVIMVNEDEAWDRWPSDHTLDNQPDAAKNREDQKCRVQFSKEALLDAVPTEERGLFAVYFHEYIAASIRGDGAAGVEVDDDTDVIVYSRRSVSPDIAQRALAEAYQTCAAGLDETSMEWNS